jgi:hypothetical protein
MRIGIYACPLLDLSRSFEKSFPGPGERRVGDLGRVGENNFAPVLELEAIAVFPVE